MARTKGSKGLKPAQLDQIRLGLKIGMTQRQIADRLGVTIQAISAAKRRMEKDGSLDQMPLGADLVVALFERASNGPIS